MDGYAEWLGVTTPSRPLNHYQLLGLAAFEGDRLKILAAAEAALGKVRPFRDGERADECQRILDELSMAKLVLCDGARKGQYDGQLRSKLVSRPAASPGAPMSAPRPTPASAPSSSAASPAHSQRPAGSEFSLPPLKPVAARPAPTNKPADSPAASPSSATGPAAAGSSNTGRPVPLRPITLASLGYPAEITDAPQQTPANQPQVAQQPVFQQPVYQQPAAQQAFQPAAPMDRLPALLPSCFLFPRVLKVKVRLCRRTSHP